MNGRNLFFAFHAIFTADAQRACCTNRPDVQQERGPLRTKVLLHITSRCAARVLHESVESGSAGASPFLSWPPVALHRIGGDDGRDDHHRDEAKLSNNVAPLINL
jgi:hypothetical protein